MNKIIHVDGGIGRVIASIPALEALVQVEPFTHILTPYPELFYNSPMIKQANLVPNNISNWAFWENYVEYGNYIKPEPYHNHLFYNGHLDLGHAFYRILLDTYIGEEDGVPGWKDLWTGPNLYLSDNEKVTAKAIRANALKAKNANKLVVMQAFGSQAKLEGSQVVDHSGRSLSTSQTEYILNKLAPHKIAVIFRGHLTMNHPIVQVEAEGVRTSVMCASVADAVVSVDTATLHFGAALRKPLVQLFGPTSAKQYGYSYVGSSVHQRSGYPKVSIPFRIADDQVPAAYTIEAMAFDTAALDGIVTSILEAVKNPFEVGNLTIGGVK